MKKKLTFIIVLLLFCIMNVNAEATIGGIKCNYTLTLPSGSELCKSEIVVENYNTTPSVKIYFENKSGKMEEYTSPNYDYKNQDTSGVYGMLRFFTVAKKNKFVDFYKNEGKCPNVYVNAYGDQTSYDVEFSPIDSSDKNSFKNQSSSAEYLKEPNSSDWKTRDEFYKNNNVEQKEDRVCKYTMNFDLFKIQSEVELRTVYNPQNNKKTYKLTVNGNTNSTESLDSELAVSLGLNTSGLVRIESSQMKKLFTDGACIEKTKVYHYLDAANADLGLYLITTDAQEASDNGVAGRFDNGDGSTGGNGDYGEFDGKLPSQGFGENGDLCSDILNENLSKLVKICITILRIAGAVIAVVNGMIALIPAVVSKNPDALKKAGHKCMLMGFILLAIGVFPTLLRVIAKIFGYDVSCIF